MRPAENLYPVRGGSHCQLQINLDGAKRTTYTLNQGSKYVGFRLIRHMTALSHLVEGLREDRHGA